MHGTSVCFIDMITLLKNSLAFLLVGWNSNGLYRLIEETVHKLHNWWWEKGLSLRTSAHKCTLGKNDYQPCSIFHVSGKTSNYSLEIVKVIHD